VTRGEAWLQHAANLLVGGSGLAYAWTVYLAEPEDPFALVNHPWQPPLRSAHVVAAPQPRDRWLLGLSQSQSILWTRTQMMTG